MKRASVTLLILKVLALSFTGLLFLALGRGLQPDMVVVAGIVLDPASERPLPGVAVVWKSRAVTTNKTGHYEIQVPVGVREVSFTLEHHPLVKKLLVLREAGRPATLDVLLPDSGRALPPVLALARGSLLTPHGGDLISDIRSVSELSFADEYGNQVPFPMLHTGNERLHSPVWLNATTIAFAKEGIVHDPRNLQRLGVLALQLGSAAVRQIASGVGALFLSKSPLRDSLAVATSREIYVLEAVSHPASLHRIFSLPPDGGFLLSVLWASDDRIYYTVDEKIPLDHRHYLTKSRVASIKGDGTDLKPYWASNEEYSFRYPAHGEDGAILFCRFALNGSHQELWSRDLRTGETEWVAGPALRAIYMDAQRNHLYYLYRGDLHLRNLKSHGDWVIANSVEEADYLR